MSQSHGMDFLILLFHEYWQRCDFSLIEFAPPSKLCRRHVFQSEKKSFLCNQKISHKNPRVGCTTILFQKKTSSSWWLNHPKFRNKNISQNLKNHHLPFDPKTHGKMKVLNKPPIYGWNNPKSEGTVGSHGSIYLIHIFRHPKSRNSLTALASTEFSLAASDGYRWRDNETPTTRQGGGPPTLPKRR